MNAVVYPAAAAASPAACFRRLAGWLLAAAATAFAGCATTGSAPLQNADQLMRQATPGMPITLRVRPGEVRTGDAVGVDVAVDGPGYLYVFQITTDGQTVEPVFPNAIDGANYLAGGSASLPRPNWRMTARGPAGVGYLVAVIAARPQDLTRLAAQARESRFAIDGPYGAAMAPLRETAR